MELVKENEKLDPYKSKTVKGDYQKINLKSLRSSLRYRPDIFKLILKMRFCIKKKNRFIIILKNRLKARKAIMYEDADTQTENKIFNINILDAEKDEHGPSVDNAKIKQISEPFDKKESNDEVAGWNLSNSDTEKMSIADQVKEAAQSALQQSGMVYVEEAKMYYDYKTGYYYNSELGLYYHTKTQCYYYYSEDAKSFVFHSYPDRSAVTNHETDIQDKQAGKRHKKDWKTDDDIDNLTKNLSQDKEDASNSEGRVKRRKVIRKKLVVKIGSTNSKDTKAKREKIAKNENDEEMKDTESDKEREKDDKLNDDLEDGECSDTDGEGLEDISLEDSEASTSTASDDEAIAKHHPPCMRVIVKETSLPKLKVGSLYLVTKDGGTVGREGDHHAILLKDHNVSRNHLDIRYDLALRNYVVMDLGSKNGTILNGVRMSESQVVSEPMEVVHGSILQMGETKLLCHIHPGKDTCGHCEPGLLMEIQEKEKKVAYTRTCSVQKQHQLELARLKNKYAPQPLAIEPAPYNDRARQRRDAVGSSHHAEKTHAADVHSYIAPENKGFKLLEKMGWSKGEGLGKNNQGDIEPIPLVNNENKTGLGAIAESRPAPSGTLGPATMRLVSKSKMLKPPAKAFQMEDDELESE